MHKQVVFIVLLLFAGIISAIPMAWGQDQTAQAQIPFDVQEAVVCQKVVDRNPVGASDVFSKEAGKLYCFNRVAGANGRTITHNWYYNGNLKASVQLTIRSNNWRTWSSKTLDPSWTGEWMVEILSGEGTPLSSIVFIVQ